MPTVRTTWTPWRDLSVLERQVNQLFDGLDRGARWVPPLDAFHRDDFLVIRLDLPGVRPDDLTIEVAEGVLSIRGERPEDSFEEVNLVRRERGFGAFERKVALPEGIDTGAIAATYDLGILEVRVPHPVSPQPKRIEIVTGPAPRSESIEAESTDTTGDAA